MTDATADILWSTNYDPYGVSFGSVGTPQTMYGFTGEMLDGGGLLDLRARRYNAGLGVFASLDPFEGMVGRPMSLNGYSYVGGNPIDRTDPSGMIPSLEEIEDNRIRYSCRCGWVDAAHIHAGRTKAIAILQALHHRLEPSTLPFALQKPDLEDRLIPISGELGGGSGVYSLVAYVPAALKLFKSRLPDVALGIHMAFEEGFESAQSIGNHVPATIYSLVTRGKRPSGFSEEDLPSDLIGHFVGRHEWLGTPLFGETLPNAENNGGGFWGDDPSDPNVNVNVNNPVRKLCDVMSKDESVQMFLRYEDSTEWASNDPFIPFQTGRGYGNFMLWWDHWYKRNRPQDVSLARPCESGEEWPSILTSIVSKAIPPSGVISHAYNYLYTGYPLPTTPTGWSILGGVSENDLFDLARQEKLTRHTATVYTIKKKQC